jgi:hypothetical protein
MKEEDLVGASSYTNEYEYDPYLGEMVPRNLVIGVPSTCTGPIYPGGVKTALEGVKFDQDKLRYDLIPPEAMEALATILTFGAKKYSDRNWEQGMNWGRLFRATLGHMWDWWSLKGNDPETGKSHLWHALCCVTFLVTYEMRKVGTDDRPII